MGFPPEDGGTDMNIWIGIMKDEKFVREWTGHVSDADDAAKPKVPVRGRHVRYVNRPVDHQKSLWILEITSRGITRCGFGPAFTCNNSQFNKPLGQPTLSA